MKLLSPAKRLLQKVQCHLLLVITLISASSSGMRRLAICSALSSVGSCIEFSRVDLNFLIFPTPSCLRGFSKGAEEGNEFSNDIFVYMSLIYRCPEPDGDRSVILYLNAGSHEDRLVKLFIHESPTQLSAQLMIGIIPNSTMFRIREDNLRALKASILNIVVPFKITCSETARVVALFLRVEEAKVSAVRGTICP